MRPTILLLLILLMACGSSTKIVQSWRDPQMSMVQGSMKKMLVLCLLQNEATRRRAEDEMCALLQGRGVSSYSYLGPLPEKIEVDPFVQRLRSDGFDAVMMMRLVDVSKEQTYVPGSYPAYYGSPYGYYGYAYPMYADPGYVRTDVSYKVESNFYSVEQQKLVWSGVTSSFNPTDLAETLDEITRAIRDKMLKDGFLTTPPTQ